MAAFTGAGRRFEELGRTACGADVYDDYAHHPTEVAATLERRDAEPAAARRRLQPHLYSRTRECSRATSAARWRWRT